MYLADWHGKIRRSIRASVIVGTWVAAVAIYPLVWALDASDLYEDAVTRFENGEYRAAIIQLKNVLQEDPKDLQARVLLGKIYLQVGAAAAAEKELRLARREGAAADVIEPSLAQAYLQLGRYQEVIDKFHGRQLAPEARADVLATRGDAQLTLRRLDEAAAEYEAAVRLRPDHIGGLLGQANVLVQRGKYAEAENLVDYAASIAPENAETWYLKANIQRLMRAFEQALVFYDKTLELDAGHTRGRISRAALLIDLRREEEARRDLDRASTEDPNNPRVVYLQALLLAREGKLKEAQSLLQRASVEILDRALGPDSNDPPTLLLTGVIYYSRGKYDDAYSYLDRYVRLVPFNAGARKVLGSILLKRRQHRSAIRILEPALSLAPEDPELFALMGSAYLQSGRFSDATEMFEKAISLAPELAEFRTQLALSRLGLGQRQEAIDGLASAFSLHPNDTTSGILLGLIHLKAGRIEEALAAANKVRARDPQNPTALNLMGSAQLRAGQIEEAKASFEQAIVVRPDYLPAQYNLAAIERSQTETAAAEARYERILERFPNQARALVELSEIDAARGDLQAAIRRLEKAGSKDSKAIELRLRLVGLYLQSGDPKSALTVAKDLKAREPENLPVLAALGRAHVANRDRDAAVSTYERMMKLAGSDARWLHRIARLQVSIGDGDGAYRSLRMAVQSDPELVPAQAALVEIEARAGKLEDARARAERLRDKHPDLATGYILLGDVLLMQQRYMEAAEVYAIGLAKRPSSAFAVRLYQARRDAGQVEVAVAGLENWVSSAPQDLDARRVLAAAWIGVGQTERAVREHEALLAALPEDPAILNNLAELYRRTGDPRALSYAEKAQRLAPTEPAALDTLGWILVQEGRPAQALKHLREATLRAPNKPSIRYHLAVALSRVSRPVQARQELERALRSGQEFDEANEAKLLLEDLSGG